MLSNASTKWVCKSPIKTSTKSSKKSKERYLKLSLKTYHVRLQCPVDKSFRCTKAANSLDIDAEKKSVHELKVQADIESPFNVGLILGSSGSGKTTLAKYIWGQDVFEDLLDAKIPIINQFPQEMSYDDCASLLSGVGLTSVPCWIRPAYTLSNGQKARAEAALAMATDNRFNAIDEWTSVVDRTVAKVMSHCVQKYARKANKTIVLNSCHYDVVDWLQPDWIIDCNKQTFENRRSLWQVQREKLKFDVREVDRSTWRYFSKYHYLSDRLPGGKIYTYGLFYGETQIGFQCFANYIPTRKGNTPIYHSNRAVIHPDYAGLGLGLKMVNACTRLLVKKFGYEVRATFSSVPLYKSRMKDSKNWKLLEVRRDMGAGKNAKLKVKKKYTFSRLSSSKSFRTNVKVFSFKFVGQLD